MLRSLPDSIIAGEARVTGALTGADEKFSTKYLPDSFHSADKMEWGRESVQWNYTEAVKV